MFHIILNIELESNIVFIYQKELSIKKKNANQ